MFLEHPQKPSDAVDKLVIQVIVDICDSIVEEHNLNIENDLEHSLQGRGGIVFSWEPALETLNSQAAAAAEEVKKNHCNFRQ